MLPLALVAPAHAQQAMTGKSTANENLMEEHGLVGRVMLIYGRCLSLLNANEAFDVALVGQAAQIIARVIHGHHEVEEERVIFPIVQRRPGLSNLVQTLRGQHSAARAITATIGNRATRQGIADTAQRRELMTAMQNFMNMYQPHGAYEDTVVYPAFRQSISRGEYANLSQQFEQNERKLNGEYAFEQNVARLARIEHSLGIDLARYTRQMESAVDPRSSGPAK
jgi:hemerythrin-like domain-containing protein